MSLVNVTTLGLLYDYFAIINYNFFISHHNKYSHKYILSLFYTLDSILDEKL